MDTICIPVPMPEDKAVEMEVTVGGETRLMQYRIETVHWARDTSADDRFEQLRDFIRSYDDDWQLVQVGSPGPESVPVTFRRTDVSPRTDPPGDAPDDELRSEGKS